MMMNPVFTSEIPVQLMLQAGGDHIVVAAAQTSSDPKTAMIALEAGNDNEFLIRSLIKQKHGSPFEHGLLTFFVDAPIFVWREHHRHRTWSYSEESARYRQLEPKFYAFPFHRAIMEPEGFKPMRPKLTHADAATHGKVNVTLQNTYMVAYNEYINMLEKGISREVARSMLPVAIYSKGWASVNPRNMMKFLELRTHNEDAQFISYPQAEIAYVANQYEHAFAQHWPITHYYWNKFGRVSP